MSAPIAPIAPIAAGAETAALVGPRTAGPSFGQWLLNGVDQVNHKLIDADAMAAQFALDDAIAPHQVTFALEQARLSLELAMQVRARLVEAYQELSRMQL